MPTRGPDENRAAFINRCMAETKMNREFPERDQRYAVCLSYADKTASKHDSRSTPAPKKDRIKGSPKNKPGSARPGGKVTFSESVTNSLKEKVRSQQREVRSQSHTRYAQSGLQERCGRILHFPQARCQQGRLVDGEGQRLPPPSQVR
jgi:hypothetical protein